MALKGSSLRTTIIVVIVAAILPTQTGCAHFIVRPHDSVLSKTFKVLNRTIWGVGTLGGTEVYIHAQKKNEAIALTSDPTTIQRLQEERDSVIRAYWITVGIVAVVAVIVIVALSDDDSGGGGGGAAKRQVIHTDSGTCSWHGGVADCVNSVAVCADGQYSPGREACYVTWE